MRYRLDETAKTLEEATLLQRTGKKETERFVVEDKSGRRYTAVAVQTVTEFRPLSGSPSTMNGAIEYMLSDGRSLNPVSPGTFEIVQTGVRLARV